MWPVQKPIIFGTGSRRSIVAKQFSSHTAETKIRYYYYFFFFFVFWRWLELNRRNRKWNFQKLVRLVLTFFFSNGERICTGTANPNTCRGSWLSPDTLWPFNSQNAVQRLMWQKQKPITKAPAPSKKFPVKLIKNFNKRVLRGTTLKILYSSRNIHEHKKLKT